MSFCFLNDVFQRPDREQLLIQSSVSLPFPLWFKTSTCSFWNLWLIQHYECFFWSSHVSLKVFTFTFQSTSILIYYIWVEMRAKAWISPNEYMLGPVPAYQKIVLSDRHALLLLWQASYAYMHKHTLECVPFNRPVCSWLCLSCPNMTTVGLRLC